MKKVIFLMITMMCLSLFAASSDGWGEPTQEPGIGEEGGMCGGIAGFPCNEGLKCEITETYPDAAGICVVDELYCRPETVEKDCADVPHIAVPGEWMCENNQCKWNAQKPIEKCEVNADCPDMHVCEVEGEKAGTCIVAPPCPRLAHPNPDACPAGNWNPRYDRYDYCVMGFKCIQHRPECRHVGTRSEGWYWMDSDELIEYSFCKKEGLLAKCANIGSKSEGWDLMDAGILWDMCHEEMGIALQNEKCDHYKECYKNLFCAKKGCDDYEGVCARKPEACTMEYDPVCGCDGKTYGNACSAASAGMNVDYFNACMEEKQYCTFFDVPLKGSTTFYAYNVKTYEEGKEIIAGFNNFAEEDIVEGTCEKVAQQFLYLEVLAPVCGEILGGEDKTYDNNFVFKGNVMLEAGAEGKAKGTYTFGECETSNPDDGWQ